MSNKILTDIFAMSMAKKTMIGVYMRDSQIDDFQVGYVIDFDEAFVAIQHVTKFGMQDGVHIIEISRLGKLETESEYLKACQLLFENQRLLPRQTTERTKLPSSDSWQYHFFNDNSCIGELIAFELNGENYYNFGFLMDFDEDNFTIHLVGQAGEGQGNNIYHISDVTSVGMDTLECRKRMCLYDLKGKSL